MTIQTKIYKFMGIPFLRFDHNWEENQTVSSIKKSPVKKPLRIAVWNGGGMGDSLIDVAFLQNLRKFLPDDTVIDYYAKSYKVFCHCPFLNAVYPDIRQADKNQYDLMLTNHRFWIIDKFDEARVQKASSVLYEFCKYQLDLRNNILRKNNDNNNLYVQYALLLGKNRWEQVDLKEITGFNRYAELYLPLQPDCFKILSRYGLKRNGYITINRGVDNRLSENCPKLWPLEYYQKFVSLFQKKYPHIPIVQIGAGDKYGVVNANINLLGKTSIEETKILLKNALLHIDVEGGLVHLNHILHGKSCVLFGPTPVTPLEYRENINLKNNVCPHYCDWVIQDWQKECLRGINPAPCMAGIYPETVLKAVTKYIDTTHAYKWFCQSIDMPSFYDETIYFVGNFERNVIKKYAAHNRIVLLKNKITPEDKAFIRGTRMRCEYGDIYNLPLQNNSASVIFWKPEENSAWQSFAFNELLRVIDVHKQIVIDTLTLSNEMKEQFSFKNFSNYLTIKKG